MGTVVVVHVTGAVVEQLVLGVVFAVLGYLFTQRSRRARGVTPWRIPAAVWAFLLFLSWEIFAVLYLIAYFTTRPRTGPAGWTAGSGRDGLPATAGPAVHLRGAGAHRPGRRGAARPRAGRRPLPAAGDHRPDVRELHPPGDGRLPQPGPAFPGYPAPGSPLAAPGSGHGGDSRRRRRLGRGSPIPAVATSCGTGTARSSPSTWRTGAKISVDPL